jgi:hypothetical protein
MAMDPEIVELLRIILMVTIQDLGDHLRIERADEWSYRLFVTVNGVRYEMVPVASEQAQELPTGLGWWESPFARAWHRATSWVRRWASGSQRGRFRFPVGAGAVSVEYRVRWRSRRVEEIDVTIRGADSVVVPPLVNPNRRDMYGTEG